MLGKQPISGRGADTGDVVLKVEAEAERLDAVRHFCVGSNTVLKGTRYVISGAMHVTHESRKARQLAPC